MFSHNGGVILDDARKELEMIRRYQHAIENKAYELEMNEQFRIKLARAGIDNNAPIVARIKELRSDVRELHIKRNKLITKIKMMGKDKYRECLLLLYVENKKISEIAETMCYEYKSIIKLHGKALKAYAEMSYKGL